MGRPVDERNVDGVGDHDRSAVVTGFLHELPGSGQVVLHHGLRTHPGRVRAAAGKYRVARPVILRLSDSQGEICYLIHHVQQCLTRLPVVERRVEVVRPEPALRAEGIDEERLEIWVLLDLGEEIERGGLPPVDLARSEGLRRGPRIGHVSPDDLVQIDLLAAGGAARGLVPRHVVGIVHVHGLLARLPLVLRELERARAHELRDLLLGGCGGDPRGHHERDVVRWLPERLEHRSEALGELERERLPVDWRELPRVGHEHPTEAVALSPTLHRLHAIFRLNRLPVMPLEPVA